MRDGRVLHGQVQELRQTRHALAEGINLETSALHAQVMLYFSKVLRQGGPSILVLKELLARMIVLLIDDAAEQYRFACSWITFDPEQSVLLVIAVTPSLEVAVFEDPAVWVFEQAALDPLDACQFVLPKTESVILSDPAKRNPTERTHATTHVVSALPGHFKCRTALPGG